MGFRCPECKKDFKHDEKAFDFHIKNEHNGKGNAFIFLINKTVDDSLEEPDTVKKTNFLCACTDNDRA